MEMPVNIGLAGRGPGNAHFTRGSGRRSGGGVAGVVVGLLLPAVIQPAMLPSSAADGSRAAGCEAAALLSACSGCSIIRLSKLAGRKPIS